MVAGCLDYEKPIGFPTAQNSHLRRLHPARPLQ